MNQSKAWLSISRRVKKNCHTRVKNRIQCCALFGVGSQLKAYSLLLIFKGMKYYDWDDLHLRYFHLCGYQSFCFLSHFQTHDNNLTFPPSEYQVVYFKQCIIESAIYSYAKQLIHNYWLQVTAQRYFILYINLLLYTNAGYG